MILRETLRRSLAALGGALALLTTPSCMNETGTLAWPTGSGDEAGARGVMLSAAKWSLAWDKEGVTPDAQGGFSLSNDQGYRLHVSSGWIIDYSVSFGPCATSSSSSAALSFGLSIASALAHEDEDPSSIKTLFAEDLTRATSRELGASSFSPTLYCRAHWLVARTRDAIETTDGVDLTGRSVWLEGTWERGGKSGSFTLDTWWPQGKLVDLQDVVEPTSFDEASADGQIRFAFVTVTRHLGRIFDGIDFQQASDEQIAGIFLNNLVGGSQIQVQLVAP